MSNKKSNDTQAPTPVYCQYAAGPCDQCFDWVSERSGFFIYPSTPSLIAETVREAARNLRQYSSATSWATWEDLPVHGQIVFCEICKAIRSSKAVVANITTLNFNVLFEIGYAIGLGKSVLPVRDTSYEKDKKLFDEIGIFDTLGYSDFANSAELANVVRDYRAAGPPVSALPDKNRAQPIYYLRSPIETDGSIKILSELKKSSCPFRTFDSRETPRLSLHEALRQVHASTAVVAHLMDPNRVGATSHNARCAFVCGLAMAAEKYVLMLQEGSIEQPIDYRDVIIPYEELSVIPYAISRVVRATAEQIYSLPSIAAKSPARQLEKLDLGDIAAENEIQALSRAYFVRTPQFLQARQGHARLVIGRKGSGKTALFYGLRKAVSSEKGNLVLDLKPEGHQFVKLREVVLAKLTEGAQQHTLTAFWHYLLLMEIARKLIEIAALSAWRDTQTLDDYNELRKQYELHTRDTGDQGDFSERLMGLVNRIVDKVSDTEPGELTGQMLTSAIYEGDISELNSIVVKRQAAIGNLWILFDNIDKGFPPHGIAKEDILIVRALVEASRKLQREVQRYGVECTAVVFVRRDVFDLLIDQTPDRGKESHVDLDWSDEELMKELVLRRVQASLPELKGDFGEVWHRLVEPHVGGESSFRYILNRTLLRPRDLLNFLRKCVQVAASRSSDRIREADITSAEREYSEDVFNELRYELRDIYPQYSDILAEFIGENEVMSREDLCLHAMTAEIPEERWDEVIHALVWFCFLGVRGVDGDRYAYHMGYSQDRINALLRSLGKADRRFVVHPAFRRALMIGENL